MRIAAHALIDVCLQGCIQVTWFPGMHEFFPSRALASETTQCHGQGCGRAAKSQQCKSISAIFPSRASFSEDVLMENDEGIDDLFQVDVAMNATVEVSTDGLLVMAIMEC